MALDLSVSETQFEEGDCTSLSNCVLLYSEAITVPGSSDILFEVSPTGQLILANFSIERRNGSYFLKKHIGDAPVSFSPEHPTNLSVDKTNTSSGESRHHTIFSSFACHGGEINHSCTRSLSEEVEYWGMLTDNADSIPQNLSTFGHNTWHTSQEGGADHPQVEDLSVSEKPVDASLPRSQTCGVAAKSTASSDSEDSGILSQYVRTLLKEREIRNAENTSDIVVLGNNLSELQRFVKRLKAYRQSTGLSQYQLSCELSKHYGQQTAFSQSLLSRFELLSVTVRAAFRLLPYLKNWLDHAETRHSDGSNAVKPLSVLTLSPEPSSIPVRALGKARLAALVRLGYPPSSSTEVNDSTCHSTVTTTSPNRTNSKSAHEDSASALPTCPAVKSHNSSTSVLSSTSECHLIDPETRLWRRERTHFSISTRAILAAAYEKNPRPRGQELTRLATETGHNRESIRIWFCNRRQLTNQARVQKI